MNIIKTRKILFHLLNHQTEDIITPYLLEILDEKSSIFKKSYLKNNDLNNNEYLNFKLLFPNNQFIQIEEFNLNGNSKDSDIKLSILFNMFGMRYSNNENFLNNYFENFNISDENKIKVAAKINAYPDLKQHFIKRFHNFFPYFKNEDHNKSFTLKFKMLLDENKELNSAIEIDEKSLINSFLKWQKNTKSDGELKIAKKVFDVFYKDIVVLNKYDGKILPDELFNFMKTPQFQSILEYKKYEQKFLEIIEKKGISIVERENMKYYYCKNKELIQEQISNFISGQFPNLYFALDNINSLNPIYRDRITFFKRNMSVEEKLEEIIPITFSTKYNLYELYKDSLFKDIKDKEQIILLKQSFNIEDIKTIESKVKKIDKQLELLELDRLKNPDAYEEESDSDVKLIYYSEKQKLFNDIVVLINKIELMEFLYDNDKNTFNSIFEIFEKIKSEYQIKLNLDFSFSKLNDTNDKFQETYLFNLLKGIDTIEHSFFHTNISEYFFHNPNNIDILKNYLENNPTNLKEHELEARKTFINQLKIIEQYNSYLSKDGKISFNKLNNNNNFIINTYLPEMELRF